jgi:[ribosomal protein S5]-alanine N-acetyltransferase
MSLPSISIDRILLRPWRREDLDALYALWTLPEISRYLWDDIVIARDTVKQAIESHLMTSDHLNIGYWALQIPPPASTSEAPIAGFCGFRSIDNGPDIELMYGLRGEYWGSGLATEACAAALEYLSCSTSYRRVYARTDPPNYRSVQVMRRLNMTHESTTASMITYLLRRPG